MGPLAPADRPAASEPGGHLVNKMSVAKETEKPHRQLWLQLSGSFLLESFRISVLDLFCFSLPSKVKFRGKVSCCKMKKADWEAKLQAFCQVCLEFRCRSKSPCEATLPRFTSQLKHPELHYVALLFSLKDWAVLCVHHHSVSMVFGFNWIVRDRILQ